METVCTTFWEGWPDLLSLDLLEVVGAGQRYTGRVRAHLAAGLTEPAGAGDPIPRSLPWTVQPLQPEGKPERVLVSFFR